MRSSHHWGVVPVDAAEGSSDVTSHASFLIDLEVLDVLCAVVVQLVVDRGVGNSVGVRIHV